MIVGGIPMLLGGVKAQYLAVGHQPSPNVSVYSWSASGFGTKFSDPATLPEGTSNGVAFSRNSNYIAMALGASPYIAVYPWSSVGFGTRFSNPATLPTGIAYSVAFGKEP